MVVSSRFKEVARAAGCVLKRTGHIFQWQNREGYMCHKGSEKTSGDANVKCGVQGMTTFIWRHVWVRTLCVDDVHYLYGQSIDNHVRTNDKRQINHIYQNSNETKSEIIIVNSSRSWVCTVYQIFTT